MTEENPKKPSEKADAKTEKSVRDKNGRFASKKPADSTKDESMVKIKVVKSKPKTKEAKTSSEAEKKTSSKDGVSVSIIGVGMPRSLDIKEILSDFFDIPAPTFDDSEECDEDEHEVCEFPDGTLKVDGKLYLPQDKVAKLLARTIDVCSQTAAEYMSQLEAAKQREPHPEKACPKQDKEIERDAKVKRIAQKFSKIAANIIMGAIGIGLLSSAAFGFYTLYNFLFH